MANDYVSILLLVIILIGVCVGVSSLLNSVNENTGKIEAKKIVEFQNTDYQCSELKAFYFKYEPKRYDSIINSHWYSEVRDKLISSKCISSSDLENIEVVEICLDSDMIGCEISKLKYPELYKDFNFLKAYDNATMRMKVDDLK